MATESKSIVPFLQYKNFPIGRLKWVDSVGRKCILKIQAGKEFCLNWDKAQNHV
jgi:hypothetical protein